MGRSKTWGAQSVRRGKLTERKKGDDKKEAKQEAKEEAKQQPPLPTFEDFLYYQKLSPFVDISAVGS